METTTNPTSAMLFGEIERELGVGMVPRIFRLLEGQPAILAHIWGQFHAVVIGGRLPRTLKEMVGSIVADTTHCPYVQAIHLHSLATQGIDDATLTALRTGNYDDIRLSMTTRNALCFAFLAAKTHASYASPGTQPGDEHWRTLRAETHDALATSGLTNDEQGELVLTVALFEQICMVANLFALDPSDP